MFLSSNGIMNLRSQCWSKERTLYRVYTRELNRELCTRLSTFIYKDLMVCVSYLQPTLNNHIYASSVRVIRSELSSFPIFFLFSIFFLNLFSFSLFLAPRVRVSDNIDHMAQGRFQKDDVILRADLIANTWLFRVSQKQLACVMILNLQSQVKEQLLY